MLDARGALASLLHVQNPDDIVFGANCTDMLNLALQGACRQGMHVLTSAYAHNSVLRPLHRLAAEGRIRLTIAVDPLARMGPERPGFAPRKRIVRSTARSTLSGFGYEVAALSR